MGNLYIATALVGEISILAESMLIMDMVLV